MNVEIWRLATFIANLTDVYALNALVLKEIAFMFMRMCAVIAWANGLKLMDSLRFLTNDSK